jgi:hypothetical protein
MGLEQIHLHHEDKIVLGELLIQWVKIVISVFL